MLIPVSCKETTKNTLWENASYTQDTTFGNGKTEIKVSVSAREKQVVFTIKTEKQTLSEALLEHKLIEGEDGPYGLYVKYVNGIRADYDLDKAYWSLTKGGVYLNSGIDSVKIKDGESYELTYSK